MQGKETVYLWHARQRGQLTWQHATACRAQAAEATCRDTYTAHHSTPQHTTSQHSTEGPTCQLTKRKGRKICMTHADARNQHCCDTPWAAIRRHVNCWCNVAAAHPGGMLTSWLAASAASSSCAALLGLRKGSSGARWCWPRRDAPAAALGSTCSSAAATLAAGACSQRRQRTVTTLHRMLLAACNLLGHPGQHSCLTCLLCTCGQKEQRSTTACFNRTQEAAGAAEPSPG